MYAGFNNRQIPPDRMDEALQIYKDSTLPANKSQQGFKGGLILADRSAGKIITIGLWETEGDLQGRTLTNFVDHIDGGPPIREVYKVSVYDRLEPESGKATHARVTTRQVQSGKMDEVIHTYRNSAVPLRRQQGSIGAILLTDRDTGNVVNITLWKSQSEMDAAAPSGDVDSISVGQHARETYEISADIS
jgi:heme-degrading monooxygenase HmoA